VSIAMAGIKIKLDEEAISEIVVADRVSESGSEASVLEEEEEEEEGGGGGGGEGEGEGEGGEGEEGDEGGGEEEEEEEEEDYQPGDRLKEGTQILILLSDQQKVCKK